jgi:putative zinc finger/helix-turn-helix YgiT family protein
MKRNCRACGKGELMSFRERVRYVASGLPNVWLDGIEVRRCSVCKEQVEVIPSVEKLHRAIGLVVVKKPARLTGAEVRFLRKLLGYSGADFARHIGVDPTVVSKWENDQQPIGEQSDRLLRMMVVHGHPLEAYPLDKLAEIDPKSHEPAHVDLRVSGREWLPTAA